MFRKYPSTYHPTINLLQSVKDPKDAAEIAAVGDAVQRLLAARYLEETAGDPSGPFRQDYASARIGGAMDLLGNLRSLARQAGASEEFVSLIDLVLDDACAARARAIQVTSYPTSPALDKQAEVAAWAKATVEEVEFNPLPDFLRDI
jgi:hypothetical protein